MNASTSRHRNETILEGEKRALQLAVDAAPLREVLTVLVETIEQQSSEGALASILLLDRDGVHLRHGATIALPDEYTCAIDGSEIGPMAGSCGTAAWTRERVIVNDIETDPRWERYRHLALPHGLHACWSTPIMSARGAVLGTFAVYHRQKAFTPADSDLEIIDLLTHTAAIVIERNRETEDRLAAEVQLKQAKEEAERANRAKDQFLAMLAHELRNPLAPIVTALELAQMRGDAASEETRVIQRQVDHLVRLVEDLLDIARFTQGKVALTRERVDLAGVIERALEIARPTIEGKQHRLSVDIMRDGLELDGDPVRLVQIVANLLSNAAKYTNPGGNISLHAARENDRLVVRIRDDGIGLTSEMQTKVFEPFVQESAALNQARGGLGLGLAIVRTLCELHGGTVSATSDGRDRGSEFVVTLPAAVTPAVRVERREDGVAPPPPGTRILIVDDNEDAAMLMSHTLRRMGYTVQVAHDGRAGLQAALEFRPHVALLDIALPFIDGYDLGRQIRGLTGLEDVRLVAATGSAQLAPRADASAFDAHLIKPISIHALSRTLGELVKR